ncbi:MAG TPA: CocE/NonD family hydrolase [Solirubrobacterales bacterium]
MAPPGTSRSAGVWSAFAVLVATLAIAAPASAAFPDLYAGDLTCSAQPANGEVRLCAGPTTTWDGQTKVDINVILPPAPTSGADGPYPLISNFHGWGGSKIGLNAQTQGWAESGYAVFSMSDRGWGNSCGGMDPDRLPLSTKCAAGYNHLMDDRYEVRDAQYLISVLADEGVAQPQKIGATGYSYGGGMSMALAALRDRTMLPDGSLVPWESPEGTPMAIAAAVPQWPWTDLAYSLMPNGRTLDYVADAPYLGPDGKAPIGIEKASYVTGLYGTGLALSNYALPGTDPDADLTAWYALINAGEPYDSNPVAQDVIAEITAHHSSYYIDHSRPPAPLLIQSGWNDDLFPVDEALRFYNRTRTQFPGDPISLYFMDDGHARSQNKPADKAAFELRQDAWFDHYLKGEGAAPASSVEALTTTCGAPSEGPYAASSWRTLAPGEIRLDSAAAQTVTPAAGDPTIGAAFDPIGGSGACATAAGADQLGAANYRLPAAPPGGFTLLGSPTVVADIEAPGGGSGLAARLLDVAPGGTETLVARGLLRPGTGGDGMVFQLHPQAYEFAEGHVVKLELLPSDGPYSRPANTQGTVTVSNLQLRLPVLEQPGALGGLVQAPAPKVVPAGYELALDYRPDGTGGEDENEGPGDGTGKGGGNSGGGNGGPASGTRGAAGLARGGIRAVKGALVLRLRCAGLGACAGNLSIRARKRSLATGGYSIPANATQKLRLALTKAGRKFVARRRGAPKRTFAAKLAFADSGRAAFVLTRPVHLKRG